MSNCTSGSIRVIKMSRNCWVNLGKVTQYFIRWRCVMRRKSRGWWTKGRRMLRMIRTFTIQMLSRIRVSRMIWKSKRVALWIRRQKIPEWAVEMMSNWVQLPPQNGKTNVPCKSTLITNRLPVSYSINSNSYKTASSLWKPVHRPWLYGCRTCLQCVISRSYNISAKSISRWSPIEILRSFMLFSQVTVTRL